MIGFLLLFVNRKEVMSLFHFFFICLLAVTLQNEVSEIQWDEKTFELQTKIALLDTNPLLAPEPGTRLQITANRLNVTF